MVIAIDGPAGSGKSTIARLLAEKLRLPGRGGFTYINSGNLYRAFTLGCLRRGLRPEQAEEVLAYARAARVEYLPGGRILLEGEDVTDLLHSDEIDSYAAPFSAIVPLRRLVNDLIRETARGTDVVAEGRDITTVVFPRAEYRFYLDASPESRAKRRLEQGTSRLSPEEILKNIQERDEIDRNKAEGSHTIAPGVE